MIVCHCKVVNDRAITAAVEAGATTLAALCQTTGAGQNCGACVWSIKALLCETDVNRSVIVPEVSGATEEFARGGVVQRGLDLGVDDRQRLLPQCQDV